MYSLVNKTTMHTVVNKTTMHIVAKHKNYNDIKLLI
jgi:hypothetical protein